MNLTPQDSEPGSVRDGLIVEPGTGLDAQIPAPGKKERTSRLEGRTLEALEMEKIRTARFGADNAEGILLAN